MIDNTQNLGGKVALITGGSQGLGFNIARRFVLEGASVIICARSQPDLMRAKTELHAFTNGGQRVVAISCDIAVPTDVDHLFEEIAEGFETLDVVVSNAGIHGPLGPIDEINWDEWLAAIAVNLSGAAYVLRKSVIKMKAQGFGKIIQLSGGGATQPHPFANSYAASKAAIVRFAETIAEEVKGKGIEINSIAPGALNTRLLEQVLEAGPARVGHTFYERMLKQQETGGAGFDDAVNLTLFLATSVSDGISGKLISALWDDWDRFPEHVAALSSSDLFTLRRITEDERPNVLGE